MQQHIVSGGHEHQKKHATNSVEPGSASQFRPWIFEYSKHILIQVDCTCESFFPHMNSPDWIKCLTMVVECTFLTGKHSQKIFWFLSREKELKKKEMPHVWYNHWATALRLGKCSQEKELPVELKSHDGTKERRSSLKWAYAKPLIPS